jgi:hypothetical protein
MGMISFVYVVLMIAGIIWVVLSFRRFMQSERERESRSRWAEIRMEKDFNAYLESLAKEKAAAEERRGETVGKRVDPGPDNVGPPIR